MNSLVEDIKNYLSYLEELDLRYFRDHSRDDMLQELLASAEKCYECSLSKERNNLVFGQGTGDAKLMFIGEGPGFEEDRQGLPFVGRSGQLLDKILQAMKLDRSEIYIANIVKCRPPNNRNPNDEEIKKCLPILFKQIEIIDPNIICALGSVAFNTLIGKKLPITANRGKWFEFMGRRLIPTFHPSYLLRNNNHETKKKVWNDMKKIMEELG